MIEVAVLPERDRAEQVVTEDVGSELRGDLQRIDRVAERLAHLLSVDGEKAMRVDDVR